MINDDEALLEKLEKNLAPLGMAQHSHDLMQYLLLLNKWNQAYNLTAIREKEAMINKHIIDSLAIAPWIKGKRIIDVGSGAGLPGIPLAISHPQSSFVLLDSNGKKIRFLREVLRQLPLKNVELIESRVENYHPPQGFDTVMSRAFSSLQQMTAWTRHLLNDNGIWLAMKGSIPTEELQKISFPYTVHSYSVAGLEARRCCVLIDNVKKD